LLTIADIIGTSPRLWNSWKDRLLADLYTSTRYALRSDVELPRDAAVRVSECSEYALALLMNEGFSEESVAAVWADFPQQSFLRHRPEQVAWQTGEILRAGGALPLVAVQPLSVRGSTELFIYTPDRDGLFVMVTAVLDRLHFSVMESRVLNSPTNMALDTFLLLEADSQKPATVQRAAELQQRLQRALAQSTGALVGADRPGLLAAVAQVMLQVEVRVHDARIATFGERVEDFFQLTDRNNAPLDSAHQERLLRALLARIAPTAD
jgi:[protein-PII] uridylyltransferase